MTKHVEVITISDSDDEGQASVEHVKVPEAETIDPTASMQSAGRTISWFHVFNSFLKTRFSEAEQQNPESTKEQVFRDASDEWTAMSRDEQQTFAMLCFGSAVVISFPSDKKLISTVTERAAIVKYKETENDKHSIAKAGAPKADEVMDCTPAISHTHEKSLPESKVSGIESSLLNGTVDTDPSSANRVIDASHCDAKGAKPKTKSCPPDKDRQEKSRKVKKEASLSKRFNDDTLSERKKRKEMKTKEKEKIEVSSSSLGNYDQLAAALFAMENSGQAIERAVCIGPGCENAPVQSPNWDGEFCSSACCVNSVSREFQKWVRLEKKKKNKPKSDA